MPRLDVKKTGGAAALELKFAACRLFAERGVDGVTVREIAIAAGQKNHGSVGYHFGSKLELIRDLVLDGAKVIDEQRNRMLDELESAGGPHSVLEIVTLMMKSGLDLPPEIPPTYLRFVYLLALTHRDQFMEILENRWNSGWLRCLDHIRRMMPDMPRPLKNQRLVFATTLMSGSLAAWQHDLLRPERLHPEWQTDKALEHLAIAAASAIMAPSPAARSTSRDDAKELMP